MEVDVGGMPLDTFKLTEVLPLALVCCNPMVPVTGEEPKSTVMVFVPWPLTICAPVGTVHTYVFPVTLGTLYTTEELPVATKAGPVIDPGFGKRQLETEIGTTLEEAVVMEIQLGSEPPAVTWAEMASPLLGTSLKVVPLEDALLLTNHVNVGWLPTLLPTAVKVTPVPEQTEALEAMMEIAGFRLGFTVRLIPLEVAIPIAKQLGSVPLEETTA